MAKNKLWSLGRGGCRSVLPTRPFAHVRTTERGVALGCHSNLLLLGKLLLLPQARRHLEMVPVCARAITALGDQSFDVPLVPFLAVLVVAEVIRRVLGVVIISRLA